MDTNSYLKSIVAESQASGTYAASIDPTPIIAALFISLGLAVIVGILVVIGRWRTVNKMGGRGWSQIIPIYSEWELSSKAGCAQGVCIALVVLDALTIFSNVPRSETFLYIALVCGIALFVIRCIVLRQVARRFGKGVGFTIGLIILPYIFYLILGCGSAQPVEENAA